MTALLAAAVWPPPGLRVDLLPVTATLRSGSTFKGVVEYVASGDKDVTVVPLVATALYMRRSPVAQLQIRRHGDAAWLKLTYPPGCGNTDPIQAHDFQTLQPGRAARRDAFFSWNEMTVGKDNLKPGTYDVRFVYDTSAPLDHWIGGPLPPDLHAKRRDEVRALYNQTPHGVFVSGAVKVVVQ